MKLEKSFEEIYKIYKINNKIMFSNFVSTSLSKEYVIAEFFKIKDNYTNILFVITPDFSRSSKPKCIKNISEF